MAGHPEPVPAPHCRRRAHAVARRLLGCDHLAADVVQEASVALWRQPVAPQDGEAWLLRAVVLRCRQLRRTLARRHRHESCAAETCTLHAGCDNPLHHAYAHELGERLAQAVQQLPAEQRTAFELHAVTGLDYRGLAARLALPVGTVRSRLHRARRALQVALQPLAAH